MGSAGTSNSTLGNGDGSEVVSEEASLNPPPLRDAVGNIELDSVPDVIQWFLDFDQRVAIVKHPNVEEVFHWKQENSRSQGEVVFDFKQAQDRLAIGIIQALATRWSKSRNH